MDHFALLPAAERATVFREAAARSRLGSATIIEKDFWVCWTLQRIFSIPTLPGPLFKGGTSLSADADRQSLLFAYPLGLEEDLYGLGTYIRPVVRLEFGCRGDVWPSEQKSIQPYIADALPGLLAQPTAEVHVLRPERTFWEKATLLHAVFHSGKMPTRLSRHHYDLSRLYRHEYGQAALNDGELLASVVEHKKVFFREAAARYDLARPGSLRVCPPDSHVAQIRSDYRDMREMFFGETPPFDQVIADLKEVEDRVNS